MRCFLVMLCVVVGLLSNAVEDEDGEKKDVGFLFGFSVIDRYNKGVEKNKKKKEDAGQVCTSEEGVDETGRR